MTLFPIFNFPFISSKIPASPAFLVPCCNFRIKTMFRSSLPPAVCRGLMMYLRYLFCLRRMVCFCFVCLVSFLPSVASFSGLSPFLSPPSVFSNVYLLFISPQIFYLFGRFGFMVFNATFNIISVISGQSVLLVEETRIPGENHWPVTSLFIL